MRDTSSLNKNPKIQKIADFLSRDAGAYGNTEPEVSDSVTSIDGALAELNTLDDELAASIMEREKTQLALHHVSEFNPNFLVIFEETKVRYANPQAALLTGYSVAELLQMDAFSYIHPDHREFAVERGRKRIAGEHVPNRYEVKLLTKQGDVRWLEASMSGPIEFPWGTGIVASGTDITDRKQAEEALSVRNRQLESMVSIAGILAESTSEEAKYRMMLDQLADLVDGDIATIRIFDQPSQTLARLAIGGPCAAIHLSSNTSREIAG